MVKSKSCQNTVYGNSMKEQLYTLIITSPWVFALAAFLVGFLIGLFMWVRARSVAQNEKEQLRIQLAELRKEKEAEEEKLQWTEQTKLQMRDTFTALASDALRANAEELNRRAREDLSHVVDPLKINLTSLDGYVRELEKSRKGAYDALQQQLTHLGETHSKLQETTTTLTQALKSPTVRGRWGELQLRRVVEMAGMDPHVAFDEQAAIQSGRPDMIVHLPNGGILPIDSKVPLEAYLEAMEAIDDRIRMRRLDKHAKAMRERVRELGQKMYWDQFDAAPDFVVMFVPNEACLGAAFERDPALLEYAIGKKVLISSPVNLLALLKAVAYGWQQYQITENALKIAREGQDLYKRIETFISHLTEMGRSLGRSIEGYNKAIASLERRLLPAARRFQEMGVSMSELVSPDTIDTQPTLPSPVEDNETHK
jgi:DNA recombination protein RmuC